MSSADNNQQLLEDAARELRRLRLKVEKLERGEREPIAIVGMACRLPGGVNTPGEFWSALERGLDAIDDVPALRWDAQAVYSKEHGQPGKTYTRAGGFVDDVDRFDPAFFAMSPREALELDPQQRLLLETSYRALEDAGLPAFDLQGTNTGVFVGLSFDDYAERGLRSGDFTKIHAHSALGNQRGIAAGRIAYTFGFQGPALQIDTTCSSSLVAVHLACQSLQSGESGLALAGGVNLMLSPEATIACAQMGALSEDGRCRTFDAGAQGYGRGEGCVVVALKPLGDALADGDPVHAVIRGSAVNHDGQSNGLTAPNGLAQTAVIRAALADADVDADTIDYVEAHGTGTPLGDPIELMALGEALNDGGRIRNQPLKVGSVKTNIGHLEAAAGITGLVKVTLSMVHKTIPPHLHCAQPTPRVNWSKLGFEVPTSGTGWPQDRGHPMRAGVSSFGMSGTNAHVIVEAAPERSHWAESPPHYLLALSARTEASLAKLVADYLQDLEEHDHDLSLVCAKAASGRSHFQHRRAFTARDRATLIDALKNHKEGRQCARGNPKIAFLFTGQGSQYADMGRDLYRESPVFRTAIDQASEWLDGVLEQPLTRVLFPATTDTQARDLLDQTCYAQPALFAIAYGLHELWRSWGIQPAAVLGHSVGEFAAACAAGILSWRDGINLIAQRGRAMQAMPPGRMLAVAAAAAEITEYLADEGEVVIAAINGPFATVLSGPIDAVGALQARLESDGVRTTALNVNHAFHSEAMRGIESELTGHARRLTHAKPRVPFISSMHGAWLEQGPDPLYWSEQARQPVMFDSAVKALTAMGCDILLEIGAQPILTALAKSCLAASEAPPPCVASLRRGPPGQQSWSCLYASLASLYEAGADIKWRAIQGRPRGEHLALPHYPFARERFWLEPRVVKQQALARSAASPLPPGHRLPLGGDRLITFELRVDADTPLPATEHRVLSRPLWPAAGFLSVLSAALEKVQDNHAGGGWSIRELRLERGLWLDNDTSALLQTQIIRDPATNILDVSVLSEQRNGWQRHMSAVCEPRAAALADDLPNEAALTELSHVVDLSDAATIYEAYAQHGIDYGARFRLLHKLRADERLAVADLIDSESPDWAWIDAGLQVAGALAVASTVMVPVGLKHFWRATHASKPVKVYAQRNTEGIDIVWRGADNVLVAYAHGLVLRALTEVSDMPTAGGREDALQNHWYHADWMPATRPSFHSLPELEEIRDAIGVQLEQRFATRSTRAYLAGLYSLNQLSRAYVERALEDFRRSGAEVSEPQAALKNRLEAIANTRVGDPDRPNQSWSALAASAAEVLDAHPEIAIELELTRRCARQLPAVLAGQRDPLSVLFPEGDASGVEALYRDSGGAGVINATVADVFETILRKTRGPLRILEIGAGTGATTVSLLPLLPATTGDEARDHEYWITDISPVLVERARQQFAAERATRFAVLDIEWPSGALIGEGFDVVIAANVLHATRDVARTLQNVRSMLRDGGQLLMAEGVRPLPWLDIIFGLTKEWWGYDGCDTRRDHVLLDAPGWLDVFASCGFAATNLFRAQGDVPQTVFVARHEAMTNAPLIIDLSRVSGLEGTKASIEQAMREIKDGAREVVFITPGVTEPLSSMASETLSAIIKTSLDGLLQIAAVLKASKRLTGLSIVTQGAAPELGGHPALAPLWGLARVFELEFKAALVKRIDLDPEQPFSTQLRELEHEIRSPKRGAVAFRDGQRVTPQLERSNQSNQLDKPGDDFGLTLRSRGTVEDLALEREALLEPGPSEIAIKVTAAGINFIDVLDTLGLLPFARDWLGAECAGTVLRCGAAVKQFAPGDRVMALAPGSFKTTVTVDSRMACKIPQRLTVHEAATVPVNFLTAWHALVDVAGLKRGERVLVHAAAGGTGLAAIQIARHIGAEVFATASRGKWGALQRLGIDRVMDSRTAEFGARVMRDTNGAGVDVVLNSLTGEAIGAGFDALAPNGRFLEIGKREVWDDEAVRERRNDVRYEVVDLLAHAAANPGDIRQIFEHLLSGFEHGDFEPLPRQVFPIESARAAFAQLERAQHIGKVVLDFDHTPHLHADASYLITGAFGGLGRATSQWLAGCGAGHLILIGRNLPAADDPFLADLQQRGISVECHALDVCDRDRLKQVIGNTISQTASRPPLRGVIHAAGILDDAPVEALDWPRLNEVLKSKVQGALNLHQLTLKLSLDFFILYSSASALLGSPGQGSHVAANSFLDALARERRQLGLPALSVAWGPWTDIGAVAAPAVHAQLHSQGIGSIKPTAGFAALARLMSSPHTCYRAVVPLDWPTFARRGAGRDPFLAAAAGAAETMGVDHEIGVTGGDWCAELAAVPARRRQQVLTAKIQIELARVLGLAKNQAIDEHAPFFDLGVDSLMSVELKTLLERALGLEIEPTLLFEKPNIATLSEALLAMLDGDNVFSQYKSSATVNLATGKASASPGGDIGAELEALEALLDKP